MENTYRDVNIALANELVKISEKLHLNATKVIELANRHPRVNIHLPGPGVGGHYLPVDPYFIVGKAEHESKLIQQEENAPGLMGPISITSGTVPWTILLKELPDQVRILMKTI